MSKKKKVINKNPSLLQIIIGCYVIASLLTFFGGIMSADCIYVGCAVKTRIEYVFPAYRLGCWLNEPLEKK